ncbi:MAG: peptide chain release factor 2, partial [Candidatus Omnitrophica bacterium]|nr:peptide chain release factor 2 [Candidatus Omnitrophota bacterium]
MAIEQIENIKGELKTLDKKLAQLRDYLDLPVQKEKIEQFEQEMSWPGFWDKPNEANKVIARMKALKSKVDPLEQALSEFKDIHELSQIIEENDEDSLKELESDLIALTNKLSRLETLYLLSGDHDADNVILSLHAGAGGTESCDWAQMLLRMYSRWAENNGYEYQVLDILPGEEAGTKSATILIKGNYAYGYLKSESGVHRLVRISPFDSNKRRHTSFASCDVMPEIDDNSEVEINEPDIRVDVYRASGPGGQSVNTTDSAVRITHLRTGIVVQCQNERSQLQNKITAMKVLRARIYKQQQEDLAKKMSALQGQKQEIAWGSQIRSYVFHPYNMVKDHRTKAQTSNTRAVM